MVTCSETAEQAPVTPQPGGGGAAGGSSPAAGGSDGGAGGQVPVPECPAQAPVHDAPCEDGIVYSCSYDDCEASNSRIDAVCAQGRWNAKHSLCEKNGVCAAVGFEDLLCTEPNQLCVVPTVEANCTPHPVWACPLNPCEHEPFSCDCAGFLCGPFLECLSADPISGVLVCDLPPPEPTPPVVFIAGYGGDDLLLSDKHAYWKANHVYRHKLIGGGMVETFVSFPEATSARLALEGDYLYVAEKANGILRRISLTNQAETVLATNLPYAHSLLVNGQVALWLTANETLMIPVTGGAPTVLSTFSGPAAMDETHVYITDVSAIYAVPITGGAPTPLTAEGTWGVAGITVDETSVYYTSTPQQPSEGRVLKVPKAGGPVVTLATNQYEPTAIVVDDVHVYFSRDDSFIMRVPKQGGQVEVFAAGMGNPHSMADDATHLYWITQLSGGCSNIWKKSK